MSQRLRVRALVVAGLTVLGVSVVVASTMVFGVRPSAETLAVVDTTMLASPSPPSTTTSVSATTSTTSVLSTISTTSATATVPAPTPSASGSSTCETRRAPAQVVARCAYLLWLAGASLPSDLVEEQAAIKLGSQAPRVMELQYCGGVVADYVELLPGEVLCGFFGEAGSQWFSMDLRLGQLEGTPARWIVRDAFFP